MVDDYGSVTATDSGISSSSSVATIISEKLSPPVGSDIHSRSFHVRQRHHYRQMRTAADDNDSCTNAASSHYQHRGGDAEKDSAVSVMHASPAVGSILVHCIDTYQSVSRDFIFGVIYRQRCTLVRCHRCVIV